jgi:hypothetical protein
VALQEVGLGHGELVLVGIGGGVVEHEPSDKKGILKRRVRRAP